MGKKIRVLIVDAQGGGIGKQLVSSVKENVPSVEITAVGTNSAAAAAMMKAGADHAATGENAVVVACRKADVIMGPVGIAIADSLWGEITPTMAVAVGQSEATRILIPFNHCSNIIAGVSDLSAKMLIHDAVEQLKTLLAAF